MIIQYENVFVLETHKSMYMIGIRGDKYPENLYYGNRIYDPMDHAALWEKYANEFGNTIKADKQADIKYTFDNLSMEYSYAGIGDYRILPFKMIMADGSFSSAFIYQDSRIYDGIYENSTDTKMPYARVATKDGEDKQKDKVQTLELILVEQAYDLEIKLIYTVFPNKDVITRRCVVKNQSEEAVILKKIMSFQLDLSENDYKLSTFDGLWARERHKHTQNLVSGVYVNESTTGSSSNRHNPFILLEKQNASEKFGECYGFNLIYSGNHYEAVEVTEYGKVRIISGIQPQYFSWKLETGDVFYSPESVMCYSGQGNNELSRKLADFTVQHIVARQWAYKERPVLINNWEATYFNFNKSKLLTIAKEAKALGIELFVLDDGWFGNRNDDLSGLGDWFANEEKLGGTLASLANELKQMGLMFGLWMEPEMVNENSQLYKKHPEWAVKNPNREHYKGRNQMILDYTNEEVRNYLVTCITNILDGVDISYVKWDMNRHITDCYSPLLLGKQGEFSHRYMLGLYDVLERITGNFPNILFESCASGGGRFDLGMLYYMPQTWTSDNTDPNERIDIQEGTSYAYPLSSMGAHVSEAPNHQTLRYTSLETRFQVACFGVLGYELDMTKLSLGEKEQIAKQVVFYKKYRKLFQFGDFTRAVMANQNIIWSVVSKDKKQAIALVYQRLTKPNTSSDILKISGLAADKKYRVSVRRIFLFMEESNLNRKETSKVESEQEEYIISGSMLEYAGIKLNQQFLATGIHEDTRIMGDFSSRLYVIEKIE